MAAQPDERRAGTRRGLVVVLLLAMLVRLPLLLTPGFDVVAYKIWARVVYAVGIGGAYGADYPPEPGSAPYHYGPVYLHILRATGLLYAALRPAGDWHDQLLAALLKLSPVVAELALGLLIWAFLRARVTGSVALTAAAAYLFTPGLIWNTAYWGGIDAFQAFFTTAGLLATVGGATALAWPLATLAVCSKLTALPGALATVPGALRARSPRGLVVATLGAIATATLVVAPILLSGQANTLGGGIFGHLDIYAETSFNTHNLWWLLTWGQGTRPDTTIVALGIDYRILGRALFIVAAAPALFLLWRFPADAPRLFATSAYLTFTFCMLTTGVHENWAYTLFAPLLLAAALDRRYRPLYAALAVTFLLNLFLEDPPLHRFVADWMAVRYAIRAARLLNAVAQCALLGWWIWLLCIRHGQGPLRAATGGRRRDRA
ncbi:MAG TPA: hypothetical protein VIL85_20480 [Thermomicrobiales bacterium]|jgi:hypothetical protein